MTTAINYTDNGSTIALTGATYTRRRHIQANGGRWDSDMRCWQMPSTESTRSFCKELARGTGGELQQTSTRPASPPPPPTPQQPPQALPVEGQPVTGLSGYDVQEIIRGELRPVLAAGQATLSLAKSAQELAAKALEVANAARPARELHITIGEVKRTVEGLQHYALDELITGLAIGLHVWLAGPSGSGKTHGAEQAAAALGLQFELQGAMTMAHELTGFVDAGGKYHETPFVRAFRNGGVILLDELDAGSNEALLTLNAALANGLMSLPSGEVIRAHKDFRCVGAANTWGGGATAEYVGRTRIDAAFLQRFGMRITWGYDETLELAMSPVPEWTKRVQNARKLAAAGGVKVLITPRHSQAGGKMILAGKTPDWAAARTYLADLSPDQRAKVGG